jgi:hypothetical protein
MNETTKVDVVAAPMSFAGSLGRTLNALWYGKSVAYKATVGWLIVGMIVCYWWTPIFCWYMIFGIFLVPYRLIRRSSRKQKIESRQRNQQNEIDERRHQEILEVMRNQKN